MVDEHLNGDGELVSSSIPDLRLIHYNDVYHIEAGSAEPVGGIARFQTVVNEYRNGPQYKGQPELLSLFSGDAFNPSLESSVTKGRHMVPFLNGIGTAVACVGVRMLPMHLFAEGRSRADPVRTMTLTSVLRSSPTWQSSVTFHGSLPMCLIQPWEMTCQ